MTTERKRLLGNNDARYCGVPESEQLFKIEEFDISPLPPVVDTRLFAFLDGGVFDVSGSDLEQTILNITTTNSEGGHWVLDMKFAEYPQMVVRQDQQYSKNLKPGLNAIIGDFVFPSYWTPTATYHYTVEARLPDGRTLFCFEFECYLEGTIS